jgi:hypothetical protein
LVRINIQLAQLLRESAGTIECYSAFVVGRFQFLRRGFEFVVGRFQFFRCGFKFLFGGVQFLLRVCPESGFLL